jgi:hypothetical protein
MDQVVLLFVDRDEPDGPFGTALESERRALADVQGDDPLR